MVAEAMSEATSLSVAGREGRPRVGVNVDALRGWIRRSDIVAGKMPGYHDRCGVGAEGVAG